MPFSEAFEDVYESAIKPACAEAGAYCERVDEQNFDESILSRIYNQISKANVVVAELTGRNPNVFYETGYAHALGKRVILLTESATDIVFDMQHFSHIVYNGKLHILKKQLQQKLTWALAHPEEALSQADPHLQFSVSGIALDNGLELQLKGSTLQVDIFNGTADIVQARRVQLAVTTPEIEVSEGSRFVVMLSDGRYMHHFRYLDEMWPQSWESAKVTFRSNSSKAVVLLQNGLPAEIRITTPMQVRTYDVKLFSNYTVA